MQKLNQKIIACERCPRLRRYCKEIATEKRRAFSHDIYWGKPVPNFGDSKAEIIVVGLAPAAHGGNRTGRMFTGDRSGDWLYRALYKAGFANQSKCIDIKDGLKLKNCMVTTVNHCAPPNNKPLPQEILNCQEYLDKTILETKPKAMVALGAIAWNAIYDYFRRQDLAPSPKPKFAHGKSFLSRDRIFVVGSYHPSQQNTFTKRLTEEMLDSVFSLLQKQIT
ncbi:MAG: uracil-DNA glycosylase [Proteobacteria bacterium SG_bin7]|nr:MAG: uracil-DNA glycosylase [Proteobacteria bacterium SG_bin7]